MFTQLEERPTGVYSFGMGYQVINDFGDTKDWDYNGYFTVLRGEEFFDNGKINFTKTGVIKFKAAKQWFGWNFAVGTVLGGYVYANAATNMIQRHMKVKYPESKEDQNEVGNLAFFGVTVDRENFDVLLRHNQRLWYQTHTERFVNESFSNQPRHVYFKDVNQSRDDLTKEKHQKQLLRKQAFDEGLATNSMNSMGWVKSLEWKGKYEDVKPGKPIRVFVDAKTENSLARVDFANSFKKHMSNREIVYGKVLVKFCSGSRSDMISATFTEFMNRDNEVVIYNFSDDSMVKLRRYCGKTFYDEVYNVDISSNDSSHSWSTFECYAKFSGMQKDQRDDLMRVIRTPFKITNPEDPRESILIRSDMGYLPSGIGDTSVCNNMVYLMLGYAFNFLDLPTRIESLTYAGFLIGFRFSYQKTNSVYEMQFLKHSVVRVLDGKYIAMPNLGTLLRYSGKSRGDLPGGIYPAFIKTFDQKCAWYQSLLTFGFFKYFRYPPVMDHLCPFFQEILGNEDYKSSLQKVQHRMFIEDLDSEDECPVYHLDRHEYYSRYLNHLTVEDILCFESLVKSSTNYTLIYCRLVDVVMEMDYGYKGVTKQS